MPQTTSLSEVSLPAPRAQVYSQSQSCSPCTQDQAGCGDPADQLWPQTRQPSAAGGRESARFQGPQWGGVLEAEVGGSFSWPARHGPPGLVSVSFPSSGGTQCLFLWTGARHEVRMSLPCQVGARPSPKGLLHKGQAPGRGSSCPGYLAHVACHPGVWDGQGPKPWPGEAIPLSRAPWCPGGHTQTVALSRSHDLHNLAGAAVQSGRAGTRSPVTSPCLAARSLGDRD